MPSTQRAPRTFRNGAFSSGQISFTGSDPMASGAAVQAESMVHDFQFGLAGMALTSSAFSWATRCNPRSLHIPASPFFFGAPRERGTTTHQAMQTGRTDIPTAGPRSGAPSFCVPAGEALVADPCPAFLLSRREVGGGAIQHRRVAA